MSIGRHRIGISTPMVKSGLMFRLTLLVVPLNLLIVAMCALLVMSPPRVHWGDGTHSVAKRHLWLDIDKLAAKYDYHGKYVPILTDLLSRSLFSFMDQDHRNSRWCQTPDHLKWNGTNISFEYIYQYDMTGSTPILELIYDSAVTKGIIA